MKTIELIQEARNKVKEISKATKTLGHNDPNSVCFILNNKQDLVITKIQTRWYTCNPCIYIGNYPMSKKEVIKRLDQLETLEKQFN